MKVAYEVYLLNSLAIEEKPGTRGVQAYTKQMSDAKIAIHVP